MATTEAPPPPHPGVIGNFQLCSKIDEGNFGAVYEARNVNNENIRVAVKLLHRQFVAHAEVRRRFISEASAAAIADHPHIVKVFDVGTVGDVPYLVMELLQGQTLKTLLAQAPAGRLPPLRAVRIALQVADALAAAHAGNIVHRDLKPSNIFLTRLNADADFVKVLDFGVARVRTSQSGAQTQAGTVLGTFEYMALEQLRGSNDVDHRTDIHALGAILYRMLAGRLPRNAKAFDQWLMAHRYVKQPDPSPLGVPSHLAHFIVTMLASDREERPAAMSEVIARLSAFIEHEDQGATLPRPTVIEAERTIVEVPRALPPPPSETSTLESSGSVQVEVIEPSRNRRRGITIAAIGLGAAMVAIVAALVAFTFRARVHATPPPPAAVEVPADTASKQPEKPDDDEKPAAPAVATPPPEETTPAKPAARPRPARRTSIPVDEELLTEATSDYLNGNCIAAITKARKADPDHRSPRAWNIIGLGHCCTGNRTGARRAWYALRGADRDNLVKRCNQYEVDLGQ